MTQKFPLTQLKPPAAVADGDRVAWDYWDNQLRGHRESFGAEPVALMVGTVYGYTLFGDVTPNTSPTSANTYIDPTGTHPIKLISKYPFATETDARVVNFDNPSGNTIRGVQGIAGDTRAYALGFSGAANSPYFDKGGWSVAVGLSSGSIENSYLDPTGGTYGGATSSASSGYVYGGYFYNSGPYPQPSGYVDTIFKFPFAGSIGKTDVGELEAGKTGMSTSGTDDIGFMIMGYNSASYSPPYAPGTTMRSMTYASDSFATLPYVTYTWRNGAGGISSPTHGYAVGGTGWPYSISNDIQKFPFVADAGTSDVGELVNTTAQMMALSSTEKGYVNGGQTSPSTRIDDQYSFPFSSETSIASTGSTIISNRFNYGKFNGAGAGTQT